MTSESMSDKATTLPCINVNGGNFESASLDDFIEQMRKLQLDGGKYAILKPLLASKAMLMQQTNKQLSPCSNNVWYYCIHLR